MERGADAQAAFDVDRREIALPGGVPVLGPDDGVTPLDPAARQQGVDIVLAAGEPHGRNIGFQHAVSGLEALEREIGQFGGQDFSLLVVGDCDIEDCVIHIM